MKNDKEDYSDKPISQSGFPDRHRAQPAPEGSGQTSPADIARSGDIFTGLVSGVPKAYEAIEHKLLGEKSPEELAAKRDIFIGLMSGVPRAWEKIEPTLPPARGRQQSGNQRPLRPAGTTDATHQGPARPNPARRK